MVSVMVCDEKTAEAGATPAQVSWDGSFRQGFCARYGCSPEDYESRAFGLFLYRHAVPLARLWMRVDPSIFREDFELLHEIATVKNMDILKQELGRFHGRNLRDKGWLRRTFLMRISGKRILRLCEGLLPR
ncbi:MAG TPA: hypothetical protein VMF06_07645 [Candidatus Limnocylindria bacterium]|jgi:hypothetical protein|nr:hypothetical protein [Candidatus Limnocylindria bacterium]